MVTWTHDLTSPQWEYTAKVNNSLPRDSEAEKRKSPCSEDTISDTHVCIQGTDGQLPDFNSFFRPGLNSPFLGEALPLSFLHLVKVQALSSSQSTSWICVIIYVCNIYAINYMYI